MCNCVGTQRQEGRSKGRRGRAPRILTGLPFGGAHADRRFQEARERIVRPGPRQPRSASAANKFETPAKWPMRIE